MRHYEITLVIHPDQSEQTAGMMKKYTEMVEGGGGKIHRSEDWGRRNLAYPIRKVYKAHYLLLNIECEQKTLAELDRHFHFNDAILRNLIIGRKRAESAPSVMMRAKEKEEQKADGKTD